MKKGLKNTMIVVASLLVLSIAGLAITGKTIGWGPFSWLHSFDKEVHAIAQRYDASTSAHEIVFYGASNFALWHELEGDLAAYAVQNHGFGGSTDKDLLTYAPDILYPYAPDVVFFQTGSNDYVGLSGAEDEVVDACMAFKREMFAQFHEQLPDAQFVVMSGLLLPGRSEYAALIQRINAELAQLCAQYDYMTFVDATQMTFDGEHFATELFEKDGIHLNRDGQLLWCDSYIQPQIERLIEEYDLAYLRRTA